MSRVSFHTGRILLSFVVFAFGLMIIINGTATYNNYLHSLRKMYLPYSTGSHKVPYLETITYDELNQYLIKGFGSLFMLSGFLILLNRKIIGSIFLIIAMAFILVTKDNPWIESNMTSIQKEKNQRLWDFLKHISVVGAAFLLMGDKGGR